MSLADTPLRLTARRAVIGAALSAAGIALLVWQIRSVGIDQIRHGLAQVGAGFLLILALSFVRFALRSLAWIALMGERVSLSSVIGATLAGDAVGNLTPLSLLVSEPAKSLYLRDEISGSRSFAALTAENFYYSVSVAIFIMLGTMTMLAVFLVPPDVRGAGLIALGLMTAILTAAIWIVLRKPALLSAALRRVPLRAAAHWMDRVQAFESSTYAFVRPSDHRVGIVVTCEIGFHVLSFLESYYTVWLITGQSALAAAFVLDTFNRIVNIVFRFMPLRVGVDEASTRLVAPAVGLTSATGITIALVRKGRMLVWAGVGIALGIRKGLTLRDLIAPHD